MTSGQVDGLRLNYALGFAEDSLDFLDAWPVRRLDVLDRSLKDLSPIERLGETLEELSLQAAQGATLDLDSFHTSRTTAASGTSSRARSPARPGSGSR